MSSARNEAFVDGSGNQLDEQGRSWEEVLGDAAYAAALAALRERVELDTSGYPISNKDSSQSESGQHPLLDPDYYSQYPWGFGGV